MSGIARGLVYCMLEVGLLFSPCTYYILHYLHMQFLRFVHLADGIRLALMSFICARPRHTGTLACLLQGHEDCMSVWHVCLDMQGSCQRAPCKPCAIRVVCKVRARSGGMQDLCQMRPMQEARHACPTKRLVGWPGTPFLRGCMVPCNACLPSLLRKYVAWVPSVHGNTWGRILGGEDREPRGDQIYLHKGFMDS